MATVREIVDGMAQRVKANSGKLVGMTASYQFEITGEDGVAFYLDIKNGAVDMGEGKLPSPGCTVSMASSDFKDMIEGKANATSLFFGGKLKISGDMGLAMKLQSLLS